MEHRAGYISVKLPGTVLRCRGVTPDAAIACARSCPDFHDRGQLWPNRPFLPVHETRQALRQNMPTTKAAKIGHRRGAGRYDP